MKENFIAGIAIGGWVVLCLYAFAMTRLKKEKAYVLSTLYIGGCILHRLAISGGAAQYMFPDWPLLVDSIAPSSICLMFIGLILFFKDFFKTKQYFRRLNRLINLALGVTLITLMSQFFDKYSLFAPYMFQLIYLLSPILTYICWRGIKTGIAGSYDLLFGYLLFFILNIASVLSATGNIPTYPILIDMPEIASFVFIILIYRALYIHHKASEEKRRKSEKDVVVALSLAAAEKKQRIDQSNFMNLVTHELKTPLAVMDSAIQTLSLEKVNIPPVVVERHTRLKHSISELNNLINTVLQAEYAEKQSPTRPIIMNIADGIEGVLRQLSFEKTLFDIKVPQNLTLEFSPTHLDLILSNLMTNAIKYKTPGSRILVKAKYATKDNISGVQISLSNEYKSNIKPDTCLWFKKYFRQLEVPNIQGFGLGLYLVKAIVEMHSGQIECQVRGNEPIWNITFTVWIPPTQTH
ncbi:7TM diverse intracellular signaling domain-containing protein [Marinomonas sp.]|uniref:sensor histidine kinase n=1 Tax=Marinomonas sp. TaxID=1904862 RepID=UPI003BA933A1